MNRPHSDRHAPAGWRLLPLLAVLLAGCDLPGRPDPADRPISPDQVLAFGALYQQNCAGCHGADGKLGPAPPLNDPLFRAIVSEEELEAILTKGRQKTLMPAFARENGGTLTAAQIQVLVKEIKGVRYKIVRRQEGGMAKVVSDADGISPQWGLPAKRPKSAPSYGDRSRSPNGRIAGNKQDGAAAFDRACAVCHGDQGQGTARGGETILAINDPVFLALNSNQVLRRYVITGRPDLGMPSYAEARPDDSSFEPLTDAEVTDLVALLASWRREP